MALAPSSVATPDGGVVVAGDATITGQGGPATTIDQSTFRAIINWDDFSIDAGGLVAFHQPSVDAITLNRVVGQDPSTILGQLTANGRIVLVNPNGVLFGTGSRIDTAGLIATTHDIANERFMAGDLTFDRSSGSSGFVINEGLITVSDAGLAAFVAPHVRNSGVISARLGTVALGGASRFTVDFYGDNLISFPLDAEILGTPSGPGGASVGALVANDGAILAEGGTILMTASAARGVIDDVILAGGELVATSFSNEGGRIVLHGGDAGDVHVAGSLNAGGSVAGAISIDGERVFADGAISANGAAGGGAITLAADWLSIGGALNANGASGGTVIVATGALALAGDISARGMSGVGGLVDIAVLGKSYELSSASIDVSGSAGGRIRNIAGQQLTTSAFYNASGTSGAGGRIDLSASALKLLSPTLNASGAIGGQVRLGGEYQGGSGLALDELANAMTLVATDGTQVDVSGHAAGGAGGNAIVWSDEHTVFLGAVDARPGAGGAGGFIEVSSKGVLEYDGQLQTGGGQVLLDPKFLTIVPDDYDQLALILGFNYAGSPGELNAGLAAGDRFGNAVALDGLRLAVGAPGTDVGGASAGSVFLFSFSDEAFSSPVLQGVIGDGFSGPNSIPVDLGADDEFGISVSLDGDRLAVGSLRGGATGDNGGNVHLFTFQDDLFTGLELEAMIGRGADPTGGLLGDKYYDAGFGGEFPRFGASVSLDGNRLAIGATEIGGCGETSCGAAFLFTFTDLEFSGGALATTIGAGLDIDVDNLGGLDRFGQSIALDGIRLVVGTRDDDGLTNGVAGAGAVYLFTFDDLALNGGELQGIIGAGYDGPNDIDLAALGYLEAGDQFGWGLSLDGARLAVGAHRGSGAGNVAPSSGEVYLFEFPNADFSGGEVTGQIGRGYTGPGDIDVAVEGVGEGIGGDAGADNFGTSVSLDGDRLAVGTDTDDGAGNSLADSGVVYLFNLSELATLATFSHDPGDSSFMKVGALLALLNSGEDVILQANSDITVTVDIIVGAGGAGGDLTLEAGRSLVFDAEPGDLDGLVTIDTDGGNLTLIANQTAAAGVVDLHRDAGLATIDLSSAIIDLGAGLFSAIIETGEGNTDSTTGALTLGQVTAASIVAEHLGQGDVELTDALTASALGESIIVNVTDGNFINSHGFGALAPGAGRFVVFSDDPGANTLNGVTGTPYYNTVRAGVNFASLPTGNVLAYKLAPTLTIVVDDDTREYGEANPAFTFHVDGLVGTDSLALALSGAPSLTTSAVLASDVGIYNITAGLGDLVSNYNYGLDFDHGELSVTAATVLVDVNDANREYGEANPDFSAAYSGFKLGQDEGVLLTNPVFVTLATQSSDVGDHDVTASGAAATNYVFTYAPGTLTIDPATVLVDVDDASRDYGELNPTFSAAYSGFKLGQDEGVLLTDPIFATAATQGSDAGDHVVTASGAVATNYVFTYAPGTLTIAPVALLIDVDNASRDYGDANPGFTATYTGFKLGQDADDLLTGPVFDSAATASSDVGVYVVTASGATSTNYVISYESGDLTVDQAALLIDVDDAGRLYGAANPSFTATYTGFKLGQDADDLLSGPTFATAATPGSPVGPYDITASGATATNYAITYAPGTLTVGQATLLVDVNDASRSYGDDNPAFSAAITGFVEGEDVSDLLTGPVFDTAATSSSDAGTYAITGSGATATNYLITYAPGVLTVNPAALLIDVNDAGREYGEANPVFTATYTGFKLGQDEGDLLSGPTFATGATASSNVGVYVVTASGAASDNYTISYGAGALTIDSATLLVTADDATRVYGDADPALTGSISGFKLSEDESVVSGLSFASTATVGSSVGSYDINGSGASAQNYVFQYTPGELTVTPASLLIAANDASRVYGDANPSFTATFTGFKAGDDAGDLAGLAFNTPATQSSSVGSYDVVASGAASQNYLISYADPGTLTISPALLTVIVDDAERLQGDPNPPFSATITGFKLGQNASVLSGLTISTGAVANSLPGEYAIVSSGGVATNYVIAQRTNGVLSVFSGLSLDSAVGQVQNEAPDGGSLGGAPGGDGAELVFANDVGSTGADGQDSDHAVNLLCVLADDRECPATDGGAE